MKVLLLGVGLQGKAALHDLAHSDAVTEIIAADVDAETLARDVAAQPYADRVQTVAVDAADAESLRSLLARRPDVVIDLLPTAFHGVVAATAIEHGAHVVNASYVSPEVAALAGRAERLGLAILPEFGLDPGIDLVLTGAVVRQFDAIDTVFTYGAGFPEPEATDNPIRYKISWTFDGVLKSYRRPARLLENGVVRDVPGTEIFAPHNIHHVEVEGLGRFEAYPNGDAVQYAAELGLALTDVQNLGRFSMRWPGHSAFWKALVDLHLLDDEAAVVDGVAVDRKRFLAAVMAPHLQYEAGERDVVIVRVDVRGQKDGETRRIIVDMIDRRDLDTGFSAMSRTVGFTASIGAQMLGTGVIAKRGLLSPINDVPYPAFVQALTRRGITIQQM